MRLTTFVLLELSLCVLWMCDLYLDQRNGGKKKNNVRGLIGLDSSFFFDPCGKGFDR